MRTDSDLIDLVKESFDADTQSVVVATELPTNVRRHLNRRRRRVATYGGAAVAACALGIALTGPAGNGTTTSPVIAHGSSQVTSGSATIDMKTVQFAGYTLKIPSGAKTTSTCLNDKAARSWARTWSPAPRGAVGIARLNNGLSNGTGGPNLEPCIGAVFVPSAKHPGAVGTVKTPGKPTVYLAKSTGKTRVAYRELNAAESANWAKADGGAPGTKYLVAEIPSDNDRSVLVALLRTISFR